MTKMVKNSTPASHVKQPAKANVHNAGGASKNPVVKPAGTAPTKPGVSSVRSVKATMVNGK